MDTKTTEATSKPSDSLRAPAWTFQRFVAWVASSSVQTDASANVMLCRRILDMCARETTSDRDYDSVMADVEEIWETHWNPLTSNEAILSDMAPELEQLLARLPPH